jgi:hypothetical protein
MRPSWLFLLKPPLILAQSCKNQHGSDYQCNKALNYSNKMTQIVTLYVYNSSMAMASYDRKVAMQQLSERTKSLTTEWQFWHFAIWYTRVRQHCTWLVTFHCGIHCAASLCCFTMLLHYAASLCCFTMLLHCAASLCCFTVLLHCAVSLWCFFTVTF